MHARTFSPFKPGNKGKRGLELIGWIGPGNFSTYTSCFFIIIIIDHRSSIIILIFKVKKINCLIREPVNKTGRSIFDKIRAHCIVFQCLPEITMKIATVPRWTLSSRRLLEEESPWLSSLSSSSFASRGGGTRRTINKRMVAMKQDMDEDQQKSDSNQ